MTVRVGVVVFPGTNCELDVQYAFEQLGVPTELLWHGDDTTKGVDAIVVPGGFSYGDYLRTGAIARFSPVMRAVRDFAARGGPVLGICNGFQILLEAGLIPGAMLRNRSVKFQCEHVYLRVEQIDTPFTAACRPGQVLRVPIAHGEGNYFAPADVIARLEANRQIVFRYTTGAGELTDEANPNGSVAAIAGLCNEARNVVGLMPHPERACESALGSADGLSVFESAVQSIKAGALVARA